MRTNPASVLFAGVAWAVLCGHASAEDVSLAEKARSILEKYCYDCHGRGEKVTRYDVLDWSSLKDYRTKSNRPYVTPGKPEESALWQRMGVHQDMPPQDHPRPTRDEMALIRDWITSGAVLPPQGAGDRKILTETAVLGLVHGDLERMPAGDRRFRRYLSIHNLHNDRSVTRWNLQLARAAIGKLINSLSTLAQIVTPTPIDPDQAVFAIDLRDIGWDRRDLWKEVLAEYPYGMTYDSDDKPEVRKMAEGLLEMTGVILPYVRADWLIVTASQPPLYNKILDLPGSAGELEGQLRIDVEGDFLGDRLKRAGFIKSGVSNQNRVVDRHIGTSIYWRSYDFRRDQGKDDILQFPLGPKFEENPFAPQAFEHAGGEIVFSLPNGMPAYMLVDGKGATIPAAPMDIVFDSRRTAGSTQIVAGLSCMGCHVKGVQPVKDVVRQAMAAGATGLDKVFRLYPEKKAMDAWLGEDEARFSEAILKAMRPWVKDLDSPEPIYTVAARYNSALGAAEVAAELGVEDIKNLLDTLRTDPNLQGLGLQRLINGGEIEREAWDQRKARTTSPFQEVSLRLKLGAPTKAYDSGVH